MPLEVFQAGEPSIAGGTDVRPWLIRLGGGNIWVEAILRAAQRARVRTAGH